MLSIMSNATTILITTASLSWMPVAPYSAPPAAKPAPVAAPAPLPAPTPAPSLPLGVSYLGWRGDYRHAPERLQAFRAIGFHMVTFVPNYSYVGLDEIDTASGPDAAELAAAVEVALRTGFTVVVKPHLEPPAYQPGFDQFKSENDSWRVACPWRGFFDVHPMTADYREGVVFMALRALKTAFDAAAASAPPVRLELGVELMNSTVYAPDEWVMLLAAAKKERHRLGLDGKVLLSHNFTHHIELPDDFVRRMTPAGRRALGRYIAGLDAVSLSQYMDLTAAVPAGERGKRLPTADEVARALVIHEARFRKEILQSALGVPAAHIPPLHIGEFGIGRGGLRHPNLWAGDTTLEQEQQLSREIARGHEGFLKYLALPASGRAARSGVLWVTGRHYDIFGWERPDYANPAAEAAIRGALGGTPLAPHAP
jgi:hypothetical protein